MCLNITQMNIKGFHYDMEKTIKNDFHEIYYKNDVKDNVYIRLRGDSENSAVKIIEVIQDSKTTYMHAFVVGGIVDFEGLENWLNTIRI